eukprot:8509698-Pyramimonas_sp.AAC.1
MVARARVPRPCPMVAAASAATFPWTLITNIVTKTAPRTLLPPAACHGKYADRESVAPAGTYR